MCFDAKLAFDANAMFRQPKVNELLSEAQSLELSAGDPTNVAIMEAEALKNGLVLIGFTEGNIGCIVNGAGLAMATMDLIHYYGGKPANFLDLGGSVDKLHVQKAFEILMSKFFILTLNCIQIVFDFLFF